MSNWQIMFDRAIAKGRSGKIIVTALVVLIGVPFAICVLGWMGQVFVVNNIPSYGVGRGLLWETIEVYIDPSNKPESFHSLKRLYCAADLYAWISSAMQILQPNES